jgi:hypothetical protein
MSKPTTKRLREGALSAEKTPTNPPAPAKLVPLTPAASPRDDGGGK